MGRQQFSGNGKVWVGVCLCVCACGNTCPGTVMKVNWSCVLLYEKHQVIWVHGMLMSGLLSVRSSVWSENNALCG